MRRFMVELKDHPNLDRINNRREEVVGALQGVANNSAEEFFNELSHPRNRHIKALNRFWINNSVLIETDDMANLARLKNHPRVEAVVEEFILDTQEEGPPMAPDFEQDTVGDRTWGVDYVQAHEVWGQLGVFGAGARVAVLDTGIHIGHQSLAGQMFTTSPGDPYYPGGWMRFDAQGNRVNSMPFDSGSHGTHVSGTVAGTGVSGLHIGVAPQAKLMGGLVLPGGSGTSSQVLAGMQWAINPVTFNGTPTNQPAHIINMSLGGSHFSSAYGNAIAAARAAGTVVVCSSGNNGAGTAGAPGNSYNAFSSGAIRSNGSIADFSSGRIINKSWFTDGPPASWPSHWRNPRTTAPGVAVISSVPNNSFSSFNGTSMSAPHTSGVLALCKSANPSATAQELEDAVANNSSWTDIHRAYPEHDIRLGNGRINALEAVKAVL